MPLFASGGANIFQYYVVARKADGSVTLPLYFARLSRSASGFHPTAMV